MKTLKFRQFKANEIIAGRKYASHRLFDDKNFRVGEVIDLIVWETGESFARAKITRTEEKRLGELQKEDWEGHERFTSDKEMYATYSKYYGRPIGPEDTIKIIRFELLR